MISALFKKTESLRLLEALCKHTNFFSILKGAICEKKQVSRYFLYLFIRKQKRCYGFGKREQTSFTHGSVNTEEKSDFEVVSTISGFKVEKCEQSSQ